MSEGSNGAVEAEVLGSVGEADAEQLAAMVSQASDEQITAALADGENRKKVLDEIFNRMAEHVDPAKIEGKDAVIHFTITDKPGGGEDTYEVVIKDGDLSVNSDPSEENPRVTLSAAPLHFIKLVTGQESGPTLFMGGKLKIKGDLMFATQMASFFRIPSAG